MKAFLKIVFLLLLLACRSDQGWASGPNYNDTDNRPVTSQNAAFSGTVTFPGNGRWLTGGSVTIGGDTTVGGAATLYATPDPDLFVKGNVETDANLYAVGAGGNYFAGNIGVGTTRPRQKLEINNTAGFSSEYDNGNSGAAKTIDWNNGNKQKITLTGNCTLTFTPPAGGVGNFQLVVVQGASWTIAWPAPVKWPQGVPPTLSSTASATDIVSFYYNGTGYYGSALVGY